MEPRERRACPLTDVGALARALARPAAPVLLDIRWRLGGPPGIDSYRAGHLPRSVFVDLEGDLAAQPGPAGRHPLPEAGRFEAAMRRAGVSDDGSVVVYDEADATAAARAWWLLCYFGHRDCRVLDGGFRAWAAAGGQVATGAGPAPASGDFTATPGQMPVLDADAAASLAREGALLDARARERYLGEKEPVDPVAGHIPGALSAPTTANMGTDGRFLPAAGLAARFATLGAAAGAAKVGVYCGSGVTAAHEVLALQLAGIPASLYVGSWSNWVADPARPGAPGPERAEVDGPPPGGGRAGGSGGAPPRGSAPLGDHGMAIVIKICGTGRTEPDGPPARPSKCGRGWGSQAGPHRRYSGGCGAQHAPARPETAGPAVGGQAGPADPPGGGPGGGTAGTAPVRKGVAMRTLGKPEGPARRAALGGLAAGLIIGLAACGNTVAGSGTAASGGPAAHASAGAGAAAQPSPSGINPGGVMIGPGPSKDVALCRAIPKLTRMVFMLSTKPPNLHVREVLPAGFPIKDRATVRELATLLCGLPTVPPGRIICPNDMGASYRMFFTAGSRGFGEVTVGMSGCRVVTGLGPPRSWSAATALEQALSQHFGIHFPLAP